MNDDQMKKFLQKNQPLPAELSEQQKSALLEMTLSKLNLSKFSAFWVGLPIGILTLILTYNIMIGGFPSKQPEFSYEVQEYAANSNNEQTEDMDDDIAFEFPTLEVGEEFLTLADSNQMQ